jgi:hypothetical protein
MTTKSALRSTGRWLAVGVGSAAASYVAYVSYAWARYGDARPAARPEEQDALLDRFMPAYEIAERHQIRINAPAEITFETARDLNLQQSPWGPPNRSSAPRRARWPPILWPRGKFRRYWSFLSPGIILIRWASLGPLKADAKRRAGGRHA